MPPVAFEPAIPANERLQGYTLDRAATIFNFLREMKSRTLSSLTDRPTGAAKWAK